jgi:hypothetical protein
MVFHYFKQTKIADVSSIIYFYDEPSSKTLFLCN